MKYRVISLIRKILLIVHKTGKVFGRVWTLTFGLVLAKFLSLITSIINRIVIRLPHKWRVRIYNFQHKLHSDKFAKHKKHSVGLAFLLILIPVLIGVFAYIQHRNNQQFSTLPYNEKIADGAWILHNQEPISQVIDNEPDEVDLNLKEVINLDEFIQSAEASEIDGDIANSFDTLRYRWVVTLSNKTNFEFGAVNADTPEGKVLPIVRVRNKDGAYVAYIPRSMNQESSITNNDDQTHNSEFIIHDSVVPKVEGNMISWEISKGITARYTMQEDRVKADYIINQKSDISNQSLSFDFQYGGGELIQMPNGELTLMAERQDAFTIPLPVVYESKSEARNPKSVTNTNDSTDAKALADKQNPNTKTGNEWNGSYSLSQNENGKAIVSIDLPKDKLAEAVFPLTVDPVVIDGGFSSGNIVYANGKNLTRDTWGNLVVIYVNNPTGRQNVWYKNYDSASWTNANIGLTSNANINCVPIYFATDMDSNGDIHVALWDQNYNSSAGCGSIAELNTAYARLNVRRDGSNRITGIFMADYQILDETAFEVGSNYHTRPTITIANKGGGPGKEKAVVSYGGTTTINRTEFRVIQKDVWNVGYDDMILDDENLVGYWRLNERTAGIAANDISPSDNDGTYTSSPIMSASPAAILGDSENTAVSFPADSYVQLTHNDNLNPESSMSWEFWVKRNTIQDDTNFYSKATSGNFYGMADGTFRLGNDGGTVATSTNATLDDNDWHHVVVTYAGTGAGNTLIYIDGAEGHVDGGQISTGLASSTTDPRIGAYALGLGEDSLAVIDEMAIYSDILTASEITEHYEKGRETLYSNTIKATPGLSGYWRLGTPSGTLAIDESTTANHGTIQDNPTLGVSGATGSDWDTAITFDGSTDNDVLVSDNDAYDFGSGVDFSLEAWVRRSSTPATSEYVMGHEGDGTTTDWEIFQSTGNNTLNSRIDFLNVSSGSENISDNRWHHIVVTMDRDGFGTWYKDGKVSGTPTDISSKSTVNITSTGFLYIGNRKTDATEWIGSIDEVAVYKGVALTADQVREHYQAANDWKNVSEERHSNGSFENCRDVITGSGTSGAVGFGGSMYCTGASDSVMWDNVDTYLHGVLNQFSGKPKRNPDSVKWDDGGSFSNLSNTIDGSASTADSVNSFTTADYIYVGDDKPFSKVSLDITNTNSNTADFATTDVEYCSLSYDGATCDSWTDLANFYDNTDNATSSFSEDGSLLFDEADNWVTNTVNSTTNKYWIRVRPDAVMDSTVSIAEVTVNNRNSNALIMVGGGTGLAGVQPAIVPWDDITDENWENRADLAGRPWYDADEDAGFWGFADPTRTARWTYQQEYPLSSAIDYINNQYYVSFQYDDYAAGGSWEPVYEYIYSIGDNKDPTDIVNWIDTGYPVGGENHSLNHDMVTVGKDLYRYLVGISEASPAAILKCTPHGANDPNICDSPQDWGDKVILDNNYLAGNAEGLVSKVDSDTVALDFIIDAEISGDLLYERTFVDLNDRKTIGAASGDDGFHRDCESGTDDQDISSIVVKLGFENADASCVGTVDSDNHAGFRFQAVDVAPGAKISSAYIDFRVASRSGTTPIDFTVYGEDADDSSAYSAQTNCTDPCTGNVGERTLTTSSMSQSINFEPGTSANEGISYRFDVTDIVQEIICRGVIDTQPCVGDFNDSGAWAIGNDLSLLFVSTDDGGGDNYINIFSYDDTQGVLEPTLQINCEDSCDEPKPQESSWCVIGTAGGNGAADCNNNWGTRKKITFDNRASDENLTNFPVLIRLDSTKIDYSKVQNDGADLRFVDVDGTTLLDYEVQDWNESGDSLVWVEVPQIDTGSNTDYVYLYYNNSNASAGEDAAGTWNSVYKGVWHLDEDPTTTLYDATGVNNGTGEGLTADDQVNSFLGGSIDFDNGTEEINAGSDTSLDSLTALTRSAWIYPTGDADAEGYFTISSKGNSRWQDWFFLSEVAGTTDQVGLRYFLDYNTPDENVYAHCYQNEPEESLMRLNQWHHVAVSYDENASDAVPILMINGQECKNYDRGGNSTGTKFNDSTYNLYIGGASNINSMEGGIDEHRVANSARSVDWLEAEYLSTKPDSTFASIAEEETDPTVSDYESLIQSEANLSGYFRLGESQRYQDLVQSMNPDGYWPMDDASGNFRDLSGNGYDAVNPELAPSYQQSGPTIFGQAQLAANFNGTDNEYAIADESIDDNAASTGFTVSLWVRTTHNLASYMLSQREDGTNPRSWDLYCSCEQVTGRAQLYLRNGANTGFTSYTNSSAQVDDGNWHHIVAWYDPATDNADLIMDGGTAVGEGGGDGTGWEGPTAIPFAIAAGRSDNGNETTEGDYAHVVYWDRVLNATEREALYTGATAYDSSTTANHGSYENTPTLGVSGAILGDKDTAATFTAASTEHVAASDNSAYDFGTGDFSLEAWFKRSAPPSGNNEFVVSHDGGGSSSDWEWQMRQSDQFRSRIDLLDVDSGSSVDITDDSWHHAVLTMDRDGYGTWYIDGQVSGTPTDISSKSSVDISNTASLWIGANNNAGADNTWDGSLDEVAIYKGRVLSAADVDRHYRVGKASIYKNTITSTSGLVGYWRLGEGGGTVAEDLSSTANDGTYTNTPTLGVTGAIQGDNDTSAYFDNASTEDVNISDNDVYSPSTTNKLSFELWVKPDGSADADRIIGKISWASGGQYEWKVARVNTGGNEGFSLDIHELDSTLLARAIVSSATGFEDGSWYHIVGSIDIISELVTLYVDGVQVAVDSTWNAGSMSNGTANLEIGSAADNFQWYKGYIDDVAIYNTVLSEQQIKDHYLAGGGTNRYNLRQFSKGVSTATGSASFDDLDASFSSADYVAVQGNDETYVDVSGDLNIHASTSALPTFMMKVNNARNFNTDKINTTAVVRSSAPASSNPIYLQAYRGGDTDDWVTIATNNSAEANTDITLTGVTVESNLSEYYINETPGVGTAGEECTDGTSNCWTYFRVYQEGVGNNYNVILSLDSFNSEFDEPGPTQIAFTNAHRYLTTNTCSGVLNPFTIETRDSQGTATAPFETTVVRVTSNTGGTFTAYSDATCLVPITNGDITFLIADTSKTFYIMDTGISNDYLITATVQSGDAMTSGAQNYTIEGGLREDSRTRIIDGTRLRGGTRFN